MAPQETGRTAPRLKVMYIAIAPIYPARSGYAVRCQTIMDALGTMADTRALLLIRQADEDASDRTAERYGADTITAPHLPKPLRAATHARAVLRGRNRWMEKFAHGRARADARAAIARFDPDVIVLGHAAIASLIEALGVPWSRVILDHHNVETVNYTRMAAVRSGLAKLIPMIDARTFRAIEAECANAVDRWAVSAPDAQVLAAMQNAPVRVVPNVAPERCFALAPTGTGDDAPPVIGFLGNYHYQPNIDAALDVCAVSDALKQKGVAHEAIIMGRDPTAEIRAKAEATGVTVTGFVDDAEPYLSRFTLQLAPITSGSGTKLKIVESLAMGIPVVTTDVGAEGLPLSAERIGVVANGTEALADACAALLANRAEAAAMAARGRAWARQNVSMEALTAAIAGSLAEVAPKLPPAAAERAAQP